MNISDAERRAIMAVIEAGKSFGYGNMIAHLQTAWARFLVEEYNLDEDSARKHTSRDGKFSYPFDMQDDLVKNGSWDESGSKYQASNKEA